MTIKEEVQRLLMSLPKAKKVSNTHVSLRCPFCGDSRKNPNKTRFYVKLVEDEPMVFYCFNCLMTGLLSPRVLSLLNANNIQLGGRLLAFNKTISRKIKRVKSNLLKIIFPTDANMTITIPKIEYLNKRLGINGSLKFWQSFKIVFDLHSLINLNKDSLFLDSKELYKINNYYVSFVTSKNDYLISRNIGEDIYKRYIKSPLTKDDTDNSFKFYTIPNKINNLSSETLYINVAEGTFDIIGVFLHVRNMEIANNLYVAITGAGFKSVLQYIISRGLMGNVVLNVYADMDKDIKFFNKELEDYSVWFKEIYVHYNTLSKDFGVPKNEINVSTHKLK